MQAAQRSPRYCGDQVRLMWAVLLSVVFGVELTHAESVQAASAGLETQQVIEVRQLVFGSFSNPTNASGYATRVGAKLSERLKLSQGGDGHPVVVVSEFHAPANAVLPNQVMHRVVTNPTLPVTIELLRQAATTEGFVYWERDARANADAAVESIEIGVIAPSNVAVSPAIVAQSSNSGEDASPHSSGVESAATPAQPAPRVQQARRQSQRRQPTVRVEADLGLQNRFFARNSLNNGDQVQQSLAANLDLNREWNGGADSIQLSAFGRIDSDDSRRTHADLRQFSYVHAASNWQLEVGIGQVFWGVVEFNHLIDVVNQTDLIENIDIEDNLGQPLIGLTLLRDWGTLEIFALPGFRERTFASLDGRLTAALPIDRSAVRYESGAEDSRVDGLVRYSHQLGAAEFGLYYFNGTRRTARFELGERDTSIEGAAEAVLIPVYDTVRQTGLDLQANRGDTAFKLEALHSVGGPEEYFAFAAGVEHTFVGVFGGRSDWGLVGEYHWDERGAGAFDSIFERDIALGARWLSNDLVDTTALFGVIWDTRNNEYLLSIEASRRLGDHWNVALEARGFGGGMAVGQFDPLPAIADPNNKLGALVRDDYVQLEFVRFF